MDVAEKQCPRGVVVFKIMSNENEVIERFPARVLTDVRDVPALQVGGESVSLSNAEQCLAVIRQHAADPSIFDTRVPYLWAARISSNRRDYYATVMDPATTLRNYVEDAIAGVAFLDSHDSFQQPCGRSFAAMQVETDGQVNVYAAFYTIPELKNQRINTTDLIDSIRSGITKDVSVGFKRGENFEMRCSICGGDMLRWDECSHIQGIRYETYNEQSGEWDERVAIGIIIDARLSEVSAVYDGATPDCMIEKAVDLASRGLIPDKMRKSVEQHIRQVLPPAKAIVPVGGQNIEQTTQTARDTKGPGADASNHKKGERKMDKENEGATFDVSPFNELLRSVGVLPATESFTTQAEVLRSVTNEMARLRGIEGQYTEYRKSETEDALTQGVRAHGEKFDKDRYTAVFERATLAEIRGFRTEWADKADAELGGGRRSTEHTDDEEDTAETEEQRKAKEEATRKVQPIESLLPEGLYSR